MLPVPALVFAGIAALLHVVFFVLESVRFTKGGTYRAFGLTTREEAEIVAPMALNQGFYNLFLAIGVGLGIVFDNINGRGALTYSSEDSKLPWDIALTTQWAEPLIVFGCACMVGAAVVLLISSRGKLLRGVLLQGVAPAIALLIVAAT